MPYTFDDEYYSLTTDAAFARALDRFLETRLEPFSAEDALAALNKKCTEENIDDVEEYIASSQIVFRGYFGEDRGACWLTRAGLFQGKEFAVKVSKMEIASGIFIPGSRCSLFANPRSFPSEYRFYSGRKALPQTVIETSLDEVLPFYALAGEEFAPQAIAADAGKNFDDILASVARVESGEAFPLKVADMREFYWQSQVKPGDCLVFTVKDWRGSRFSVRVRRQGEDAEGVEEWRRVFWGLLERSFEDAGPWISMEDQVSEAFFIGRSSGLFALPPDDIINAIDLSPNIGFFPFGMETRLWKEGKEFPVHEDWETWLVDVLCGEDDDLFFATNFPALPEVLYAYIEDSLWRGEDSPLPLVGRLCEANGGKTTKACLSSMKEIAGRGYDALSSTYNVFEDVVASARAGFLDFYSRIVSLARFCQSAGAPPSKLNAQHILVLTQLSSHLIECLRAVCQISADDSLPPSPQPPAEALSGMDDLLGGIEDALKSAAENYRSSRIRRSRSKR